MKSLKIVARHTWQMIRAISGDDAYERYLEHWHKYHANEGGQPLDLKTFFNAEQIRKWDGVRRCC
ncbi:MAG: YbdD/YjiX family protein [Nitrosomonadaceae bacterium]